jgi:large subunit ribosomal protein L5
MNRLKQYYHNILEEDLLLKQNPKNIEKIIKISTISLNNSSKNYLIDEKLVLPSVIAAELLGGQSCKNKRSKKSIANFKLLKGSLIGFQVNFRKDNLYYLLDKLFLLVAPNSKSFKAYSKNQLLDFNGITLSVTFPLSFPEFEENYNFFEYISAFDLSLDLTTKSKAESILLLSGFQIPFVEGI